MLVINITKLSLVECSFFLFFSILVTNKYSINKKKELCHFNTQIQREPIIT